MHRFYLPTVDPGAGEFPLDPSDTKKICRVLRLAPGSSIQIWDAAGESYQALITRVTGQFVYVRVIKELQSNVEAPLQVILVQGIPKGDKMELIIQKATEIGVWMIIPVLTERTVVRIPIERQAWRIERWQTIAREAARQCGRVNIPEIAPITDLNRVWSQPEENAVKLVCWEEESEGLKQLLRRVAAPVSAAVYFLVGPEGGLSRSEVEQGTTAGWLPVSLGPRILRTETAGLVAASLVLYEWGDLGGC